MADKENAEVTETEPSAAEKLDALLKKAGDMSNGESDREDEFGDGFKEKMDRYMKTEAGKKYMTSCGLKKADEEPSPAEELIKAGLDDELEQARRDAADEGRGERELGYFLHLPEGNSFFKAQGEMAAGVHRLEKALADLIVAQKLTADLADATARAVRDDLHKREELTKAHLDDPRKIKTVQQGASLAPPAGGNVTRVDKARALEALAKAAENSDSAEILTTMQWVKQTNGNLGAIPDGTRESVIESLGKYYKEAPNV